MPLGVLSRLVQDSVDNNPVSLDPVNDGVGEFCQRQFSCAWHPSRLARIRERFQLFRCAVDGFNNFLCGSRVVLGDIFFSRRDVVEGALGKFKLLFCAHVLPCQAAPEIPPCHTPGQPFRQPFRLQLA